MKKTRIVKINSLFIIIVVFIFLCLIFKLCFIGLDGVKVTKINDVEIDPISLSDFANNRDTRKRTLTARRGTIYSAGGEVLAKDVNSYTVIAYLEPSRTKDENNPYHVVDKEKTAELLSPLINMTKEKILSLLNTRIETCNDDGSECILTVPYQVELGPGGRGITELLKDQIDELGLPGIDFISSTKRYYPNGDFLSYTLGYAKMNDEQNYVGEMGLELYYNEELTGTNGYIEYQADRDGYQITSNPSVEVAATPGSDIYLTIDTNVQMFTEQALTTLEKGKPEWATVIVANAKTGEILGVASSPSFNNNTLEIKSYYDPAVSYAYEPGSTMKIFSFLAAMENGIYDGDKKYKSGVLEVDDAKIKDWNGRGWGKITYDEGFMGSSNVAASLLALDLGRGKLKDFYGNLGFGKETNIPLPNEANGVINFRYNTDLAASSYGQGITVNAMQMVQALTAIANDGVLLEPFLVSKIVNSDTGEVVLENSRTEIRRVASEENVKKIISLMRGVVDGSSDISTGTSYYIKGYDLIGKTGTAEIASSSGGYLTGSRNYVRSFAGIFPGKDPEIIVYAATSKSSSSNYLKTAIKALVKDVGTYLNIYGTKTDKETGLYPVDSYINKDAFAVSENLNNAGMEAIVIGEGDRIINQYPKNNVSLNIGNKIFLLTNSNEYKMLDIKGWSRSSIKNYCSLVGIECSFTGYGYATEFNIPVDSVIDKNKILEVKLVDKYKKEDS